MRKLLVAYRTAAIFCLLLLLAFTPAAAQPAPAVIVFSTAIEATYGESDGANQLYQVNADGTGLTLLLDHLRDPVFPVWSPDGRYLAFRMKSAIYVLDSAQLASPPIDLPRPLVTDVSESLPAWTLDSAQLLFMKFINSANYVYSINRDGTGERRISTMPAEHGQIAVLPDGRIAFQTLFENFFAPLVVLNADGSDPVYFTVEDGDGMYQACGFDWSPVGFNLIMNLVTDEAGCVSVGGAPYVNNADGMDLHRLTLTDQGDPYFFGFAWSPDGTHIAAATYDLAPIGYYTFAPDGSDLQYIGGDRILPDADQVSTPQLSNIDWSPDGQQLAFAWSYANPAGSVLYVAEADGSGSSPIIQFNPDIVWITRVVWQTVS